MPARGGKPESVKVEFLLKTSGYGGVFDLVSKTDNRKVRMSWNVERQEVEEVTGIVHDLDQKTPFEVTVEWKLDGDSKKLFYKSDPIRVHWKAVVFPEPLTWPTSTGTVESAPPLSQLPTFDLTELFWKSVPSQYKEAKGATADGRWQRHLQAQNGRASNGDSSGRPTRAPGTRSPTGKRSSPAPPSLTNKPAQQEMLSRGSSTGHSQVRPSRSAGAPKERLQRRTSQQLGMDQDGAEASNLQEIGLQAATQAKQQDEIEDLKKQVRELGARACMFEKFEDRISSEADAVREDLRREMKALATVQEVHVLKSDYNNFETRHGRDVRDRLADMDKKLLPLQDLQITVERMERKLEEEYPRQLRSIHEAMAEVRDVKQELLDSNKELIKEQETQKANLLQLMRVLLTNQERPETDYPSESPNYNAMLTMIRNAVIWRDSVQADQTNELKKLEGEQQRISEETKEMDRKRVELEKALLALDVRVVEGVKQQQVCERDIKALQDSTSTFESSQFEANCATNALLEKLQAALTKTQENFQDLGNLIEDVKIKQRQTTSTVKAEFEAKIKAAKEEFQYKLDQTQNDHGQNLSEMRSKQDRLTRELTKAANSIQDTQASIDSLGKIQVTLSETLDKATSAIKEEFDQKFEKHSSELQEHSTRAEQAEAKLQALAGLEKEFADLNASLEERVKSSMSEALADQESLKHDFQVHVNSVGEWKTKFEQDLSELGASFGERLKATTEQVSVDWRVELADWKAESKQELGSSVRKAMGADLKKLESHLMEEATIQSRLVKEEVKDLEQRLDEFQEKCLLDANFNEKLKTARVFSELRKEVNRLVRSRDGDDDPLPEMAGLRGLSERPTATTAATTAAAATAAGAAAATTMPSTATTKKEAPTAVQQPVSAAPGAMSPTSSEASTSTKKASTLPNRAPAPAPAPAPALAPAQKSPSEVTSKAAATASAGQKPLPSPPVATLPGTPGQSKCQTTSTNTSSTATGATPEASSTAASPPTSSTTSNTSNTSSVANSSSPTSPSSSAAAAAAAAAVPTPARAPTSSASTAAAPPPTRAPQASTTTAAPEAPAVAAAPAEAKAATEATPAAAAAATPATPATAAAATAPSAPTTPTAAAAPPTRSTRSAPLNPRRSFVRWGPGGPDSLVARMTDEEFDRAVGKLCGPLAPSKTEFTVPATRSKQLEILVELQELRLITPCLDESRKQLLKKVLHLETHPDHGKSEEDRAIRNELSPWWNAWLVANRTWYLRCTNDKCKQCGGPPSIQ